MSEELNQYSCFDAMSSQQLETLLRLDAEGVENLDTDSLLYIMELLAARTPDIRSAEEAYEEFKNAYLPRSEKRGKHRLWAVLGTAAAVAAIAVLVSALMPGTPQPAKPREFTLQNLTDCTVAITDADGSFAALGTVACDGNSIIASIDAMNWDDDYAYYAVVTYSYSSVGTGNMVTENFSLTTAEEGYAIRQVVYSQGSMVQVRSASASFYAVEKSGNGETRLIAEVESFPFIEDRQLPSREYF